MVGFLPPDNPRIRGTVSAVEQELVVEVDGLPPGEAAASGSPTATRCRTATRRHVSFSSVCYPCATMSACWRRSATLTRGGRPGIFRRHSHMSP
jgi:hypothetical protein